MVGPNIQPHGLSLRRPITAPVPRRFPNGKVDPQPKILNQCGKWVQSEVPLLIAESQAQPLTATSTFTATLPGVCTDRFPYTSYTSAPRCMPWSMHLPSPRHCQVCVCRHALIPSARFRLVLLRCGGSLVILCVAVSGRCMQCGAL